MSWRGISAPSSSFAIGELVKSATALRRELHRKPYVSNDEFETARKIKDWIGKNTTSTRVVAENLGGGAGFLVKVGHGGEAGDTNNGRNVLLRADIDALPLHERTGVSWKSVNPGCHHACGHDGHASSLALSLALLERNHIPLEGNNVYAIFQAAEETGEGAQAALSDDRFASLKIDAGVYGAHNIPGVELGKVQIVEGLTAPASVGVCAAFRGERGHSSAKALRTPVPAIAQLTSSIVTAFAGDETAHCAVVGLRTPTPEYGVSPGLGEVHVTFRAETFEKIEIMCAEFESRARDISKFYKLDGVDFHRVEPFTETVSDATHCTVVEAAADRAGLARERKRRSFPWSEDCGLLIRHWECGGCFYGIGAGEKTPALHAESYDWPDALTGIAAGLWVEIATGALHIDVTAGGSTMRRV
eukprot:g5526.t1